MPVTSTKRFFVLVVIVVIAALIIGGKDIVSPFESIIIGICAEFPKMYP